MNNYKNIKSVLTNCELCMDVTNETKPITDIIFKDKIRIVNITSERIACEIEREIRLVPMENLYAKATLTANLLVAGIIDKDSFIKDIKSGMPILGGVFSKLSFVISQLTSASPLGVVITPPMYETNKVVIE